MDAKNLFMTRHTYWLTRLEYGLALLIVLVLFVAHIGEVRWVPAAVLFAYIDVIGYLPGAIAYRRSRSKRISRLYYVLYNVMHSLVTQAVVTLVWIWFAGFEWALLAIPIHLFGDRALFGNFLKPFAVHFEPVLHPAYARLCKELNQVAGTDRSRGVARLGVRAS